MADDPFIPKGAIQMVGAMIAFSLIVVATAKLMPQETTASIVPRDAHSVASLTFADRPDGAILVKNDAYERVLPADTNGFIRGAVRALAHERRVHEVGPEEPFVLVRERSGRLTLADPSTGAVIDLRAFGKDNALAFAALMPEAFVPGGDMVQEAN